MHMFLIFLFLFSFQVHASDEVLNICDSLLLDTKNITLIKELDRLRRDIHQSTDRVSTLLLKKDFDARIAILAQALNVDAKKLALIDFSTILAKSKKQIDIVPEKKQTRADSIPGLKNDPDFNKVLNWLNVLQADSSVGVSIAAGGLMVEVPTAAAELIRYGMENNNISAMKAALLHHHKLFLFLNWSDLIKYNDAYLTKVWITDSFALDEKLNLDLLNIAIKEKAWNVANALIDYSLELFLASDGESFIDDMITKNQSFKYKHVFQMMKVTYENAEFLKKILNIDAEDFLKWNILASFKTFDQTYTGEPKYDLPAESVKVLLPYIIEKEINDKVLERTETETALFTILLNAVNTENLEDVEFVLSHNLKEGYCSSTRILSLALKAGKINLATKLFEKGYTLFGKSNKPSHYYYTKLVLNGMARTGIYNPLVDLPKWSDDLKIMCLMIKQMNLNDLMEFVRHPGSSKVFRMMMGFK